MPTVLTQYFKFLEKFRNIAQRVQVQVQNFKDISERVRVFQADFNEDFLYADFLVDMGPVIRGVSAQRIRIQRINWRDIGERLGVQGVTTHYRDIGQRLGVIGTKYRDITERQRAQAQNSIGRVQKGFMGRANPSSIVAYFSPRGIPTSLWYRSQQRKAFYASGLYWAFYPRYGLGMVYKTSSSGNNWSAENVFRTDNSTYVTGDADIFSLWFDGTYVHYSYCDGKDGSSIFYRRGTPNSDGTITWSAVEQTAIAGVGGTLYSAINVSVDSTGRPFVAYVTNAPQTLTSSSSTSDGTWSTAAGFPFLLHDTLAATSVVIVQIGVVMSFVYTDGGFTFYGRRYATGLQIWEGESSRGVTIGCVHISGVSVGGNVHVAYTDGSSGIGFVIYRGIAQGFTAEEIVSQIGPDSLAEDQGYPSIFSDTINNTDIVVWVNDITQPNNPSKVVYKRRNNAIGSWDVYPTILADDTSEKIYVTWISSFHTWLNNRFAVFYETDLGVNPDAPGGLNPPILKAFTFIQNFADVGERLGIISTKFRHIRAERIRINARRFRDVGQRLVISGTKYSDITQRILIQRLSYMDVGQRVIILGTKWRDIGQRVRIQVLSYRDIPQRMRIEGPGFRHIGQRLGVIGTKYRESNQRVRLIGTKYRDVSQHLLVAGTKYYDVSQRLRIQFLKNRDIGQRVVFRGTGFRDISERIRVQTQAFWRDVGERIRLSGTKYRDIGERMSFQYTTTIDRNQRIRLQGEYFKSVSQRTRLQGLFWRDITQRILIQGLTARNISQRAQIQGLRTRDIGQRGRFQGLYWREVNQRLLLQGLSSRNISQRAVIQSLVFKVRDVGQRTRFQGLFWREVSQRILLQVQTARNLGQRTRLQGEIVRTVSQRSRLQGQPFREFTQRLRLQVQNSSDRRQRSLIRAEYARNLGERMIIGQPVIFVGPITSDLTVANKYIQNIEEQSKYDTSTGASNKYYGTIDDDRRYGGDTGISNDDKYDMTEDLREP